MSNTYMNPTETALARMEPAEIVPAELVEDVREGLVDARSPATRRAYASDWRTFTAWAAVQGVQALPASPAVVAAYLRHLEAQGRRVTTISRALAAISEGRKAAGHESPRASAVVRLSLRAIRRRAADAGRAAPVQKAAILPAHLRAMLAELPDNLLGVRDRALLLLGFAGGFRRSELVALKVEDVAYVEDGMEIIIRRSKTDQEGVGRVVPIPFGSSPGTCPVRALKAWLGAAGITTGPIFHRVDRHGLILGALAGAAVGLVGKKDGLGRRDRGRHRGRPQSPQGPRYCGLPGRAIRGLDHEDHGPQVGGHGGPLRRGCRSLRRLRRCRSSLTPWTS